MTLHLFSKLPRPQAHTPFLALPDRENPLQPVSGTRVAPPLQVSGTNGATWSRGTRPVDEQRCKSSRFFPGKYLSYQNYLIILVNYLVT